MKLITYITASLFTSLSLLAILFKTMHWPGGNAGLVLGLGGLALFVVPLIAIYKFNKK